VWLLLSPRGYLSSFTKIGTIFLLALGVIIVNPGIEDAGVERIRGRRRADHSGSAVPVLLHHHRVRRHFRLPRADQFRHHAEDDRQGIGHSTVGYGAMLIEGVVGIMALIAAASMAPGDYFAINVPAAAYAKLTFEGVQMVPVNVPGIEVAVGETVIGRTGGAVSLAVGMAQIFSSLPGMQSLLAYWYHFAIMFEALFILTTIDSGRASAVS
jgi:carbon starvation protein